MFLLAAACGSDDGDDKVSKADDAVDGGKVTIVSQQFPEADIMTELYAALLTNAGFEVSTKALATRDLYLPALQDGSVQISTDYLSSMTEALNTQVNGEGADPVASADPDATLKELNKLAGPKGLTALQPAQAQDALEEITITGSRIVRRDLESSSPIITVDTEALENTSNVGIEATLNNMPQFVAGDTQYDTSNTEPSAFVTPGIASLNLRGLGTNRNLVLINGRPLAIPRLAETVPAILEGFYLGQEGGTAVAETISARLGTEVPLLGRIPFDVALRTGGDAGLPLVLSQPDSPAAVALQEIALRLGSQPRGLAGLSLGLTPSSRA